MTSILYPGTLPKLERRSAIPRHLLALTGGGFRGLFTGQVLASMEAEAGGKIASRFDLIAGTSIGGILAIGLACGISAADLVALVREHGPAIFRKKLASFGGFAASQYDSAALRNAIERILGNQNARRPFADIPAALCVVAVEDGMSTPQVFRTRLCSEVTDRTSTLDVAMATSAAPTYFDPHKVGDTTFVDGGLIANAPDLVLICEALRLWGAGVSDLHLCSVGTAGSARIGRTAGNPGKLGWTARHRIIELILDAQAALAFEQVARLRPASFLRIERRPARPIALDDVAPETAGELLALADQAVAEAKLNQLSDWRRFLAHSPVP